MKCYFSIALALFSLACLPSGPPKYAGELSEPLHFKINSINKIKQLHHEGLELYLAASPHWSLRREVSGWIAVRRPLWQGKLYASLDDRFAIGMDPASSARITLQLSTQGALHIDSNEVTRVHGSVKDVRLRLKKLKGAGLRESIFIIAGPTLVLKVEERSNDLTRRFTKYAVETVVGELKRAVSSHYSLKQAGYLRELIGFRFPANVETPPLAAASAASPLKFWSIDSWPYQGESNELEVTCNAAPALLPVKHAGSCQSGQFQALARIHLSEPADLFLRVRRLSSGRFLTEDRVQTTPPERLPSAGSEKIQFAYVASLKLTSDLQSSDNLSVELWMLGEQANAPRMLAAASLPNLTYLFESP